MNSKKEIWNKLEKEIDSLAIAPAEKQRILNNLMSLKQEQVNILLVGATGCGKSSTINALFGLDVASVGDIEPETMEIRRYDLDNLILWDSPGLGDSPEQDQRHCSKIVSKLGEKDHKGCALIDLVLVVVDGSSRDMGTVFELVNHVLIPNLQQGSSILIAINQCDMAMKGDGWDFCSKLPEQSLLDFMDAKVESVIRRVKDATGVTVEPIYYSAKYRYNITKLLFYILKNTREEKALAIGQNMNQDADVWRRDDRRDDYKTKSRNRIGRAIAGAAGGAAVGAKIGSKFGPVGTAVGAIAGAVIGFLGGLFGD